MVPTMSEERIQVNGVLVPLRVIELRETMKDATAEYKAALAELSDDQRNAVLGYNYSQQAYRKAHREGKHPTNKVIGCLLCWKERNP